MRGVAPQTGEMTDVELIIPSETLSTVQIKEERLNSCFSDLPSRREFLRQLLGTGLLRYDFTLGLSFDNVFEQKCRF